MQLSVKPGSGCSYPLKAVLIKGDSLALWLEEIEKMRLKLDELEAYPVPGPTPNSVWGCLLIFDKMEASIAIGRNQYYQSVQNRLFIPAFTNVYPQLSDREIEKLFPVNAFIYHPDIGFAELEASVQWQDVLHVVAADFRNIQAPEPGVFIPSVIRRLEIKVLPVADVLSQMEQEFPEKKQFATEPLTTFEKKKLDILRRLFTNKRTLVNEPTERSGLMQFIDRVIRMFSSKTENLVDDLQQDYENLEQRNKDELQKLMDLFKNDPDEALKYAIPLDPEGAGRGGNEAGFGMHKRWNDFSLGGGQSGNGSGGGSMASDSFYKLSAQYHQTAQRLIKEGDFQKAAFVYLKLLKNPALAAQTLEQGFHYSEAAAIHLKYNNDRHKAAECYFKGNMFSQAQELYKELNAYEKVGDIAKILGQHDEASSYYGKVIEDHVLSGQFVMASSVYRNKMNDNFSAQQMLLEGWRLNKDASNCLSNYFSNIDGTENLQAAITDIYTSTENKELFLSVIKEEHAKHIEVQDQTRAIAYEIVAELSEQNPHIVSSLKHFNKDPNLVKDILRFQNKGRQH